MNQLEAIAHMLSCGTACQGNEMKVTFSGAAHWSLKQRGFILECTGLPPRYTSNILSGICITEYYSLKMKLKIPKSDELTQGDCKTSYVSQYHPADGNHNRVFLLDREAEAGCHWGKKSRHGAFTVRRKVTIILHKQTKSCEY